MLDSSGSITRTRIGVVHVLATCDDCRWLDDHHDGSDGATRRARAATRKHVKETGHTVQVEVATGEVYRAE